MNNRVIISLVVLAAIVGGVLFFRSNTAEPVQPSPQETTPVVQDTTPADDSAMEEDAMMEAEGDAMIEDDSMMEDDTAMEDDSMMAEEVVVEVELDASNFTYSQEEISVTQGDTVRIVLNNVEGTHDWNLDEFDASTEIITEGETVEVTFTADQVGTFEYYCSVGNHRQLGMVGNLVVEAAQ